MVSFLISFSLGSSSGFAFRFHVSRFAFNVLFGASSIFSFFFPLSLSLSSVALLRLEISFSTRASCIWVLAQRDRTYASLHALGVHFCRAQKAKRLIKSAEQTRQRSQFLYYFSIALTDLACGLFVFLPFLRCVVSVGGGIVWSVDANSVRFVVSGTEWLVWFDDMNR